MLMVTTFCSMPLIERAVSWCTMKECAREVFHCVARLHACGGPRRGRTPAAGGSREGTASAHAGPALEEGARQPPPRVGADDQFPAVSPRQCAG